MKKITKYIIAGAAVAGVGLLMMRESEPQKEFVTAKVVKGDIVEKITATGTINPISTVNIGTQVSGTIAEILWIIIRRSKKGKCWRRLTPPCFRRRSTSGRRR